MSGKPPKAAKASQSLAEKLRRGLITFALAVFFDLYLLLSEVAHGLIPGPLGGLLLILAVLFGPVYGASTVVRIGSAVPPLRPWRIPAASLQVLPVLNYAAIVLGGPWAMWGLHHPAQWQAITFLVRLATLSNLTMLAFFAYLGYRAYIDAQYPFVPLPKPVPVPEREPAPSRPAAATPPPLSVGTIVPRIKTPAFLAAMPAAAKAQLPLALPLVGDLLLSFAVDIGAGFSFLTPQDCVQRRLLPQQLRPLAVKNITALLLSLPVRAEGALHHIAPTPQGDDLEACLILLPEFWNAAAQHLGDNPVAIFPHRNHVWFTAAGSIAALRAVLARQDFSDRHALSRQLYLWKEDAWSVLQE